MNIIKNDAYEILQQREVPDVESEGILLRHKKSGARICILSNEDVNKVFYIAFRTPPKDSTGTPHIIEHTVLCGSRKFPLKDPFIELVKGSMNTFLNAMTYPDKTMYPVASTNDQDFTNLMDVYMDSVFYPNIYKNINIFRQEGWHYEIENPEGPLTVNGIVYNEMKGAFSSPDSILEREILRSLYPDTPYSNESGGDPEVIPTLSYEDYLEFHRTYYHPSNSYIYLYGNMDVNEKLEWLDREYLSAFDRQEVHSEIPLQKPFENPVEIKTEYSVSSGESEEKNTYLSCSWSVGTNLDPCQYLAFDILDFALLSRQGSPIRKALLEAGIGDDISGGYDSSTYQPMFSIIAKHADYSQKEEFLAVIERVLKEQVEKGLNKKTLLAALNTTEFKLREADYGTFPKGLMIGIQLMDSWLYDENAPFTHLEGLKVCDYLRGKLDTDYFEQLIQKYLLDNSHKVIVSALPKRGLNADNEKKLADQLEAYRKTLSAEEIQELMKEEEELHAFGEEPSSQEALRSIPLLKREDMKKEAEPLSNRVVQLKNTKVCFHDYSANGIVYLDILFNVRHVPEELVPYLGILKTLFGKVDTSDYRYADLADEMYLYTGGISASVNAGAILDQPDDYTAVFEIRIRVLKDNLEKALALSESMILRALYEDDNRLYQILAEARSRLQVSLSESGHLYSMARSLSYFNSISRFNDLVSGIAFYKELEEIVSDFDECKEDLKEKLRRLMSMIFVGDHMLLSCTCTETESEEIRDRLDAFAGEFPVYGEQKPVAISLPEKQNEGFTDASQIQYVSLTGRFDLAGYPYTGALRIFKSIMSYDYLWTNIRVKGGAYGCSAGATRTGCMYFTSYRDPHLQETLEVYRNVTDYLKSFDPDERDMTKFVIGTFSELDTPLTPYAKGRRSLSAYFSHLTSEMIQKEREEVLHATAADIRALAGYTADMMHKSYLCVIGNEEILKAHADLFDSLEPLSAEQE